MKIKYWLMISYFIVMILPVMILYFLYLSISSYDQKQNLLEYMNVTKKIDEIESELQIPSYYDIQPIDNYKNVLKLTDESIKISLYRFDGALLFSSIEDSLINSSKTPDELYQHLNELQKNYRTYSLKKPVFHDGKLVGIYEITIGRNDWIQGVNHRTMYLSIIFISFFLLLYVVVIKLLNRKLNRPLLLLRKQMTAFANGETVPSNLKKTTDEMGELAVHFEQMKSQIEQTRIELHKQQKEKEFIVASLSHDLKTPLTVIRAYTEALQKDKGLSEDEKRDYRTILFEKLEYMKQIIDDLTMYTALQSSQEKIELVEVDGDEFFDMLLSGYEEPCAKKGLLLTVDQCIQGSYDVNVKQMIRIVDNVMSNGIRHTEQGNPIWLAAVSQECSLPKWIFPPFYQEVEKWRQGGTVILIQNQGNAIPVEQQSSIFQPFVQGEGARGLGGSSGLGLSIAQSLMEQHNGSIRLWSKAGYGTLVACWLQERKG
ncbi:HAMP domain-containing sensor histidine kinase [Niallia sp. 01092]|uniref:HAMP domain-containing sensor histidine kinase n=1 Tax=unclassified Niallia TaxID=2837522 RepID=UPI003FD3B6B9